jgi:hypothetical protein
MTNDEYKLIADVLRHRMNDLTKLFEDGGFVPKENVPRAMKAQNSNPCKRVGECFWPAGPHAQTGNFHGCGSRRNESNNANGIHPGVGKRGGGRP